MPLPVAPQIQPQTPILPDVAVPKMDSLSGLRAELDKLKSELDGEKLDKRFDGLRKEMIEGDLAITKRLQSMQSEISTLGSNQKGVIELLQSNTTTLQALKAQVDKGIGMRLSIDGQLQEPVFKPLGGTFIRERVRL